MTIERLCDAEIQNELEIRRLVPRFLSILAETR